MYVDINYMLSVMDLLTATSGKKLYKNIKFLGKSTSK